MEVEVGDFYYWDGGLVKVYSVTEDIVEFEQEDQECVWLDLEDFVDEAESLDRDELESEQKEAKELIDWLVNFYNIPM